MWDNKDQICQESGKLIEPSLAGGSLFDIHDSHSLSEIALKGLANSGAYLARKGVAKAIKSDYAKKKIKMLQISILIKSLTVSHQIYHQLVVVYSTENEEKSSVVERWNRTIFKNPKCGNSSQFKVIQCISICYLKY